MCYLRLKNQLTFIIILLSNKFNLKTRRIFRLCQSIPRVKAKSMHAGVDTTRYAALVTYRIRAVFERPGMICDVVLTVNNVR